MKLYTEEQVIDIFQKYGNMSEINARNIIDLSESIELPSDEEIDRISFETYRDCPNNPNEHPEWEYNKDFNAPRKRRAFNKGAKWMRDKIKGGNK
jgi:hypothetical protein